ncbi:MULTISPECIES: hypothetical protein [Staphylococcus]|uniref:hypothetical protein n=1 Tax=Staphylococcus TaxID=1279 RepID=UPI000DF75640|nr:hypothetical protein [Staphylococcus sp. EZ-P03]
MKKLTRNFKKWIQKDKLNAGLIMGGIILVIVLFSVFFTLLFKAITPDNQGLNEGKNKNSNQKSVKQEEPSEKIKKLEAKNREEKYVTVKEYKTISNEAIKYMDKGNDKINKAFEKANNEGSGKISYLEVQSAYHEYADAADMLLAIEPPTEKVYEYNKLINILNDYMKSIKYFNEYIESDSMNVFIEGGVLKSRATEKLKELKNQ